jgi:zinc protease
MLEHMAFNGSTHFKPGELVAYFESVGVAFGPHVNAYTSYDETVYMLNVPTDRAGALDHALQALSDFAGGMSLTDKEIDKERGVVLEEWRQRLGVASRCRGSRIAPSTGSRSMPSGFRSVCRTRSSTFRISVCATSIATTTPADRIAIIVAGDLDAATAEQLIRQYFARSPGGSRRSGPSIPCPRTTTRVSLSPPIPKHRHRPCPSFTRGRCESL